MKIKNIKPIPKTILDKFYTLDCWLGPAFRVNHNFFSYLTSNDGELVKVTVATRFVKDRWFCKQVAVHGVNSPYCFAKDIDYYFLGGYVVDWTEEGITTQPRKSAPGWGVFKERYFAPYAPLLNPEYALRFKKYRYSAADKYKGTDIIRLLRLYEEHPQVELFVKFGFANLALSTQILKKTDTDKAFRKWLIANRERLSARIYSTKLLLDAYRQGIDIDEMDAFYYWIRQSVSGYSEERIKQYFPKKEWFKLYRYLTDKQMSLPTYMDYFEACRFLGLDVESKQNRYPADLRKWHDIRIQQQQEIQARKRLAEKQEQLKNFPAVVEKYLSLQYTKGKNYVALIATCPEDLIREGSTLHHCVGKNNYDIKFAQEQSLIFFIRHVESPETPYVTVEYSPSTYKILQVHGEGNAMPDEETKRFVEKTWLPYANKQVRQLQIAA